MMNKYSRQPGDSILALLEPGEYVLNRNAVDEIGRENLDDLNYDDAPRFDMSQRGQFQAGGMLGDMIGYQEGGDRGLRYAEEYEYSPTSMQKLLDKLPGLGGKRDYDRAMEYEKAVHWNPEDVAFRESQARKSSDAMGSASMFMREEDDITTKNLFQQRSLVANAEDPRSFGYRNISEDMDKTFMNQYIYGSPSGHIMETDDTVDYAVDPSNIVKSSRNYSGILGALGIPKYSGSVKENPGIDPYIDPEYFKKQIEQVDAQKLGGILGLQAGGDTLSYGGATTTGASTSFDDLYKRMGMQPKSQQLTKFEEQYAYDPTREGTWFEDYGRSIQGATQTGRAAKKAAGQQERETQATSGFMMSGDTTRVKAETGDTIMQEFLEKEGAAKSTLFKGVRGEREDWMRDVGSGLTTLESAQGTTSYGGGTPDWAEVPVGDPNWNPPPSASNGQVYNMDGTNYYWSQSTNSWETEQDFLSGGQQQGDDRYDYYASDVRLKKDINYLFTMNNGVPIYTFKYKWSDDVSIGTMAQDIEDMIPEAVLTNSNGYKMVNYSKVFNYGKI
jgi:hypothetical protein